MTLRLKACSRCGGDLSLEREPGNYEAWTCIQCGHEQESSGTPSMVGRAWLRSVPNTGRVVRKHKGAA